MQQRVDIFVGVFMIAEAQTVKAGAEGVKSYDDRIVSQFGNQAFRVQTSVGLCDLKEPD